MNDTPNDTPPPLPKKRRLRPQLGLGPFDPRRHMAHALVEKAFTASFPEDETATVGFHPGESYPNTHTALSHGPIVVLGATCATVVSDALLPGPGMDLGHLLIASVIAGASAGGDMAYKRYTRKVILHATHQSNISKPVSAPLVTAASLAMRYVGAMSRQAIIDQKLDLSDAFLDRIDTGALEGEYHIHGQAQTPEIGLDETLPLFELMEGVVNGYDQRRFREVLNRALTAKARAHITHDRMGMVEAGNQLNTYMQGLEKEADAYGLGETLRASAQAARTRIVRRMAAARAAKDSPAPGEE